MKAITLILISIIPFISNGQEFNKLDEKGKKTGYWKLFLDENINPTDSINAFFWGYEFYDEGIIVCKKFPKTNYYKNCKLIYSGAFSVKGNPLPLDGIIKWVYTYDGKEEILIEDTYQKGFTLFSKEYAHDELWISIDFTKKYKNMEGSCYVTDYFTYFITTDTRKKTSCYWHRKAGNKWKSVKTACE